MIVDRKGIESFNLGFLHLPTTGVQRPAFCLFVVPLNGPAQTGQHVSTCSGRFALLLLKVTLLLLSLCTSQGNFCLDVFRELFELSLVISELGFERINQALQQPRRS